MSIIGLTDDICAVLVTTVFFHCSEMGKASQCAAHWCLFFQLCGRYRGCSVKFNSQWLQEDLCTRRYVTYRQYQILLEAVRLATRQCQSRQVLLLVMCWHWFCRTEEITTLSTTAEVDADTGAWPCSMTLSLHVMSIKAVGQMWKHLLPNSTKPWDRHGSCIPCTKECSTDKVRAVLWILASSICSLWHRFFLWQSSGYIQWPIVTLLDLNIQIFV